MTTTKKIYSPFTKNSLTVLARRYQAKDEEGNVIEEPDGVFRRVAKNLAQAERNYFRGTNGVTEDDVVERVEEEFYDMMRSLDCLPNSPTLMNAGRRLQMLSACFVLPIEDDMYGIFNGITNTAMIHKSGGGTGFAFSGLRPKGDVVGSTGGIASGPISFLEAYDKATDVVKQGGTRRGANMAIMSVTHPDILDFIHCKEDGKAVSNFNISIAVTEEWMEKVKNNEEYELVNPRSGKVTGTLNARDVFYNHICPMAWKTGDPGLWFVDRVNTTNPNPHLGRIESCNPCGEQELLSYESCNLASVNLGNHVNLTSGSFDWEKLRKTIRTTVRLLDNVIDMNVYPLAEIGEMSRKTRRIGLGLMGWADALIALRIKYDSTTALTLAREVMSFIQSETHNASESLAGERGCYPAWEGSIYHKQGRKMRNSAPVTIAPTGTISIIAGASSGIEPLFALSYTRNVMDNDRLVEVYQPLQEEAQIRGFDNPNLWEELTEKGGLSNLSSASKDQLPPDVFDVFRTSHEISGEWHIRMQAAFQEHTDNSVSKTINYPKETTPEEIAGAYMLAYKLDCKGITVYRDSSKDQQVLSFGSNGSTDHTAQMKAMMEALPVRPKKISGETVKMITGHGNMYVTLNHLEGKLVEAFTSIGKAGGCEGAQMEAITRLISLALRSGVTPDKIIEQLKGITCCPIWADGEQVRSAPDAIALAMEDFLDLSIPDTPFRGGPSCPDCFSQVIFEEGCAKCSNIQCSWSKCD